MPLERLFSPPWHVNAGHQHRRDLAETLQGASEDATTAADDRRWHSASVLDFDHVYNHVKNMIEIV